MIAISASSSGPGFDRIGRRQLEPHAREHVGGHRQGQERRGSTLGRLVNDDTIANNVEQITEDAGSFIRSITRLQTIIGLRSEYNIVANTLKTYVSVQLMSRPDKFFLIELVDDPRGFRTDTTTYTTTDDPSKPQTTVSNTTTITDRFRFSFMLAKRIFLLNGRMALTGRFGINESTGSISAGHSAGAGIRRGCARCRSISICSTSAPTSIRASRSSPRSSSTSTSGSSAASTTCSTAAVPAPACRRAATTSSARSSPSTTTTFARCSPSAAPRCSARRDADGQDLARQSVPSRSRAGRRVGVVPARRRQGRHRAIPAGERSFLHEKPTFGDVIPAMRGEDGSWEWDRGGVSAKRVGERLHADGGRYALIVDYTMRTDADFGAMVSALEKKHDIIAEGCFGPRGEEPGRLYLAAPRALDPAAVMEAVTRIGRGFRFVLAHPRPPTEKTKKQKKTAAKPKKAAKSKKKSAAKKPKKSVGKTRKPASKRRPR